MIIPHAANALFHALKKLEPHAREQIEAVADAIGCPEWTEGRCNRDGECYCATAARRVVEIEKGQQ